MDLNKMLVSGTSLVPKGHTPRWEVDGERCEQITLLLDKDDRSNEITDEIRNYRSLYLLARAIKLTADRGLRELLGRTRM